MGKTVKSFFALNDAEKAILQKQAEDARFYETLPEQFRKLQADFAALKEEHEKLKQLVSAKMTEQPAATVFSPKQSPSQIGKIVYFGNYEWFIIAQNQNKMTLLSKNVLYQKQYNLKRRDIMWVNCDLRLWLNTEFLNQFSTSDRAVMLKTICDNKNNRHYGTKGGKETEDYVYLLSLEEAERLAGYPFGSDLLSARTEWWLRTPGKSCDCALLVMKDGYISNEGRAVDYGHGVRPVITINRD